MTILSTFMSLFPASVVILACAALWPFFHTGHPLHLLWPVIVLYFYPLMSYRLINLFTPLKPGSYNLAEKKYNPWWGSHQIQLIYFALPFLENVLRIFPGVYSSWLRLWGAKVGKSVYWTPNVEIIDRPLVQIGDRVIFGHKTVLTCHVILPHKARISLYVKPIELGAGAFIGAGTVLGPGVKVDAETFLPLGSEGRVNQHFTKDK